MKIKTIRGNFRAISNGRITLSSIISINSIPFGQNQYACLFMMSIFNSNSPTKYDVKWDPDLALNYIKIIENNKVLSLKDLTLTFLVALTSQQRV